MDEKRAVGLLANPGPMARWRELIADPKLMEVLVRRITEGGETLKKICREWEVPLGKMFEWIAEDRGRTEEYLAALRISAETDVHETVVIADEVSGDSPTEIAKAKVRIDARFRRAAQFDRPRFGPVAAAVNVQVNDNRVVLDRDAMLLETARGFALVLEEGARAAEVEVVPELAVVAVPESTEPVEANEQPAKPAVDEI